MITLPSIAHTNENGIEEYTYESALRSTEYRGHCLTSVDSGPWRLSPVNAGAQRDITIAEAKRFVDEIKFLIDTAERLERARAKDQKDVHPADAAITAEVQAILGDLDWTVEDAAIVTGLSKAKLLHRINGHSSWTLADLAHLADGLSRDDDERRELLRRLTSLAIEAADAEGVRA